MLHRLRSLSFPLAVLLLTGREGARSQAAVPDLTQGGTPDRHHDWRLGPTGARGWIWGRDLETTLARQIQVTRVDPGSPAAGVLAPGDVILGVGGQPFDRDARKAFGDAITVAESEAGGGQLRLLRWRAGATTPVTLRLPVLGSYGDRAPWDCAKTAKIAERACRHLLATPLRDDVQGLVGALALLATGRPECLPPVVDLAHRIAAGTRELDLGTGMCTWQWGHTTLFLAEYFLATGDAQVLPALREHARKIARGQSAVGTWGHGMSLPQHAGGLGGYGAVNQTGLTCWLSLVLAQRCGITEDVVVQAVARAQSFFAFYTDKGSIPYGDHPPYFFLHDNNGKNAEAAVAFDLLGDAAATRFFARMSTASYAERELGHTGNWFGYLWGPLGVARLGPDAAAAHVREQRWFYELGRGWDGSFAYQGGAAADDWYQGWDATGILLLTCCLPLQKLHITGKGTTPGNRLSGAELAAVVEDGRHFDAWHMHDGYLRLGREALLTRLASWSPTVRYRAANALAKQRAPVVPQLVALLGSPDHTTRYGACQALERLGRASAPAVDALIAQLADPDPWLQIRAAHALCEIGPPARVAVPRLLQLVLAGTPGDPRETTRRHLGIALFLASHVDNCPSRGLLADSFEDVDRPALQAIRLLLACDDGMVRWHLAGAFQKLSAAELDHLWPDLLRAVAAPAQSGEMFANEIRMAGLRLLATHHIEEGLRAGLHYARHQDPWGSQDRMAAQMEALATYGVAAQALLPELEELLAFCRGEDFPADCKRKKVAAVEHGIAAIRAATTQPVLRRIGVATPAPCPEWQHHGVCWLLTTRDGAALPAGQAVTGFPVLVTLRRPEFDFTQARAHGEDLRVTDAGGQFLPLEIDTWDAATGTASVWVRVPRIAGDQRQPLHLHWGHPTAASASDGRAVFGADDGFVTVLHLDPSLRDAAGLVTLTDQGTTVAPGRIGSARHLDGQSGLSGGDHLTGFPSGAGASSTSAWLRAERPNTTVVAWGQERRPGKVMMNLRSPPHMAIQCYFADVEGTAPVALGEWTHVVHTYQRGDSRVYVNGVLDAAATPLLDIPKAVRLDLGGWHGHGFVGDLDEVRISNVVRSPAWIRLEHENQKPLQSLVGPVVAAGDTFALSAADLTLAEGETATVTAQAGGAQKLFWLLVRDGRETLVAVDQHQYVLAAGRVTGDQRFALRLRAVFPQATRTLELPVTVREAVPEPEFTLDAPSAWDGRQPLRLAPRVANLAALRERGAAVLRHTWRHSGIAVVQHEEPGELVLERAQGSGSLVVELTLDNGGAPVTRAVTLQVQEPARDAWVPLPAAPEEAPEDHQFFARDDTGLGTLWWRGTLAEAADTVFVRVTADGLPYAERSARLAADRSHALAVPLRPGLVRYRAELGCRRGDREVVLRTAEDLVCGDVLVIDGQSNAEATDVGKDDPPEHSEWVRSFGCVSGDPAVARTRVWGNACVRARDRGRLQIGYWAMVLGQRLVASQQVPICILNGAVGGSRIDQHQRSAADPADAGTIYGRLLWRLRAARLTHGVRAIVWHQGENDQGADGPSGQFGCATYRALFEELAAGWRRDYPNWAHLYVFQIWPKACAMGRDGSDDQLREVQRTLPRQFAHLSVLSTLGIQPPGGCHFPLAGWAGFARLLTPLIERDLYGQVPQASITPPDLVRVAFADAQRDRLVLEFDQPVAWEPQLAQQFALDGARGLVVGGEAAGNLLTLQLSTRSMAQALTYLVGDHWRATDPVLRGRNGIAALTFCRVPIEAPGR